VRRHEIIGFRSFSRRGDSLREHLRGAHPAATANAATRPTDGAHNG
jgi:hypothetical protein